MTPTPSRVRYHYVRVRRAHIRLQEALTTAHNEGALQYDNFSEESPCYTNGKTHERIEKTMEKQLAQAMREELSKEIWK